MAPAIITCLKLVCIRCGGVSKYLIPILILLAAALARMGVLAEDVRFHGDEALFATYARNAAVYGDWMLSGPLDKPPVSLYAMALSMQFTGVTRLADGVLTLELQRGEWSARLAGALAGLVTVALVMAAARQIGGRRAAWFAGVLAALSPQMAAFDATAFTDPLLVTLLTASLTAALYGRSGWSGLLLAAAFATKQQAIFYGPLLVAVTVLSPPPMPPSQTEGVRSGQTGKGMKEGARSLRSFLSQRALWHFLTAAVVGVGVLLLWDAARPEPSIFTYAADNNNPYRLLVPPDEWLARLSLWLTFGATAFGAPPVTALAAVCAFLPVSRRRAKDQDRTDGTDSRIVLLRGFIVGYILLHIVLPFNIYDRYLLLIYPLLAVLAARGLARIVTRRATLPVLIGVALLVMSAPTRFPTDVRDRHTGLITLAAFVNRQGTGTIVYNRWLGWEMGYYLGPWSDKRVVHYPTPRQFADDAPLNPDTAPRLLIAPSWADVSPWLEAAAGAGFEVHSATRSAGYGAWWLEGSVEKR